MKSVIVAHLRPEFEPVAVVWSNTIPDAARQFKKGRFRCILYLFAEASLKGKVAGGSRETIACNGGRAALGLGVDFDTSTARLDRFAAVFSKGLQSTNNLAAYQAQIEAVPEIGTPCWNLVSAGGEIGSFLLSVYYVSTLSSTSLILLPS